METQNCTDGRRGEIENETGRNLLGKRAGDVCGMIAVAVLVCVHVGKTKRDGMKVVVKALEMGVVL